MSNIKVLKMENNPAKSEQEKILRGSLTLSRLLDACPWFVPAKNKEHSLQLGWRLALPMRKQILSVSRISGLSAESTVAFGAICGVFPDEDSIALSIPPKSRPATPWERILGGSSQEKGEWELLPTGGAGLPLETIDAGAPDQIQQLGEILTDRILKAPGESGRQILRLRNVLRRLLTEVLMNVHEHAYPQDVPRRAWFSAALVRGEVLQNTRAAEGIYDQAERDWLIRIRNNEVLEIAIADAGVGIPASLAPASINLLPSLTKGLQSISAGRIKFKEQRRQIHTELCDHAFRHFSTRRKEFETEHHRLNWRGLYRCYRQVVELGGTISITSGQGRAGYIPTLDGTSRFAKPLDTKGDLPGTLITVCIPLPPRQRSLPPRLSAANQQLQIHEKVLHWSKLKEAQIGGVLSASADELKGAEYVGVAFPFASIGEESKPANVTMLTDLELRLAIERLQQHVVPILCFVSSNEDWRIGLRHFVVDEKWKVDTDGPPRLVGHVTQEGAVQWGFAGAIPEIAQGALESFENTGRWEMGDDKEPVVKRLFQELRAHYPKAVVWNSDIKSFRLVPYQACLSVHDFHEILDAAFHQYWQTQPVRDEVVTEGGDKVILLTTGTRVRRHFSAFKMLNQSEPLTLALGRLLGYHLHEVSPADENIIVIDQPGSRYIAHALLDNVGAEHKVYAVEDLVKYVGATRPVVVFSDAVLHGRTAEHAVEEIRRLGFTVAKVIACVDLRMSDAGKTIARVPFVGLATPKGFDVEEVDDFSGMEEMQTDVLTNVVVPSSESAFLNLSDNKERSVLLQKHPELFCLGFHLRGGRTHTASLPFSRLLEVSDPLIIANWICDSVKEHQDTIGFQLHGCDVVVFTPFDSRVSGVINHVATRLQRPLFGANNTFLVRMPVAHAGSHSIFPPADSNPLSGCTEIGAGRFAFAGTERPESGYLALYLADASVTGNSLRHFLHRVVTAAKPEPNAVIAVVGINRLSPGEIRFFDLCDTLGQRHSKDIPFAYDYLFSLQVRSRPATTPAHHPLLDAVLTEPLLAVGELRDYLESLRRQSSEISDGDGLKHLFCPAGSKSQYVISAQAVLFRHLLALNQQNEPVILEILRLLKLMTAVGTEDPSILCVLALEPSLLLNAPLRQFGSPLLIELALRVLRQKEHPVSLRSDALVVLAGYPHALVNHFSAIANEILEDNTLRLQLAVHLLEGDLHRNDIATTVIDNYISLPSAKHLDLARRLRDLLQVCSSINRLNRPAHRDTECREVVRRLGSQMLHHASGIEDDWDGLGTNLSSLAVYWQTIASEQRRSAALDHCQRGITFAETTILPGFAALAFYARDVANIKLAHRLDDAYSLAQTHLSEFRRYCPSSGKRMTMDDALKLDRYFSLLRETTWLSPTTERLLGGQPPEAKAGSLPQAFPKLFSAPLPLLGRVAEEIFQTHTRLNSIPDFISRSKASILTVCSVPVAQLRHIYWLLLDNIRRCGHLDSISDNQKHFRESAEDTYVWQITIKNVVKPNAKHGDGVGLDEARRAGDPFGIKIDSSEMSTGLWSTVIAIPRCFTMQRTTGKE